VTYEPGILIFKLAKEPGVNEAEGRHTTKAAIKSISSRPLKSQIENACLRAAKSTMWGSTPKVEDEEHTVLAYVTGSPIPQNRIGADNFFNLNTVQ
jgi:hypothetical protein